MLNETHEVTHRSWVASANAPGTDFPLQNLPFGVFRRPGNGETFRGGVAIGDQVLDLRAMLGSAALAPWLTRELGAERAALALAALHAGSQSQLNELMGAGPTVCSALRLALSRALREGSSLRPSIESCLVPMTAVEYALPARIGDYTDFYASIHHATRVGQLFRPDRPLLPNYKWLPIAYHGRSSSLLVSGQPVIRPHGQILPPGQTLSDSAAMPTLAASRRLDYELELGAFIGAGNALGAAIPVGNAEAHLFGLCLLNDWSARDLQVWESQPLGPLLAKNFATTISPWIVTLEALEPYRCPWTRARQDPPPLPYLDGPTLRATGAVDIELQVLLQTEAMRRSGQAPMALSRSNFHDSYWALAQMVAHHTINGCNLRPGDLLGTGTQSGPEPEAAGCLLELTRGGREPLRLPNGEQRGFLEDGDTIILRGWCERPGTARIGFGEAAGCIQPAAGTA
jgi:fumarylacetoacetase